MWFILMIQEKKNPDSFDENVLKVQFLYVQQ